MNPIEVEWLPGQYFQAAHPTPAQCGRDWRGMWAFFVRDWPYRRALFGALADNRPDRLARILAWGGRPDTRACLGAVPLDTLLAVAASVGSLTMAKVLLERGASPSLPSGSAMETPLCIAARRGDRAMCELLLAHGARWEEFGRDAGGRWLSAMGQALRTSLAGFARQSLVVQRQRDAARHADALSARLPRAAPALSGRPRM